MSDGPGWETMRGVLGRVAVGPQGSRDLSREDAREALSLCLDRQASDIQIGAFLLALRLKRETDEENAGFMQALVDASTVRVGPAPQLATLADPYDGFLRGPHFGPVTACVLACAGLPTVVHGTFSLSPKEGITARQVLESRGLDLGIGGGACAVERAAVRLAERGVAYVDVSDFCPGLAGLAPIRRGIAKRPFLATLEKLISPLRGAEQTHLVAGWVHSGYEELLIRMAEQLSMSSALLVRGPEGHVDPWVHRDTDLRLWRQGEAAREESLRPKSYGLLLSDRPEWPALDVATVSALWDEALHRKRRTIAGQTVRALAGTILCQAGLASTIMRGVGMAHAAIISGRPKELMGAYDAA